MTNSQKGQLRRWWRKNDQLCRACEYQRQTRRTRYGKNRHYWENKRYRARFKDRNKWLDKIIRFAKKHNMPFEETLVK